MKQKILDDINHTIYKFLLEQEILKRDESLQDMLLYALGFKKDGSLLSGGKRLRPLFCCLSCGVVSGYYEQALPYAAALEMLHNFTLVHDDIEDNGEERHNRPALWKRETLPLALNAGDMLYELALYAASVADFDSGHDGLPRIMKMSADLFLGQHRDISFGNRTDISEREYLSMVRGKTSALLGCSFALGAMAGGADEKTITEFEYAGRRLGIAFQIRDDYLGTWGDEEVFGKSVSGDIMEKKNTLAVIYTAERDEEFRRKWEAYDGNADQVREFAAMMENAGAPAYLNEQCEKYTQQASETLDLHRTESAYQTLLDQVISSLTNRDR